MLTSLQANTPPGANLKPRSKKYFAKFEETQMILSNTSGNKELYNTPMKHFQEYKHIYIMVFLSLLGTIFHCLSLII
jgi:hypothetical protein